MAVGLGLIGCAWQKRRGRIGVRHDSDNGSMPNRAGEAIQGMDMRERRTSVITGDEVLGCVEEGQNDKR